MNVQDRIRDYITQELGWPGDPAELTGDVALLDRGIIDSLSVAELSAILQIEYDVTVEPTDVVKENFASIDAIAAFVARKRVPAAGPPT
ncbi:MAG: acyl carrier protein [Micromonosporaceae bacterium]